MKLPFLNPHYKNHPTQDLGVLHLRLYRSTSTPLEGLGLGQLVVGPVVYLCCIHCLSKGHWRAATALHPLVILRPATTVWSVSLQPLAISNRGLHAFAHCLLLWCHLLSAAQPPLSGLCPCSPWQSVIEASTPSLIAYCFGFTCCRLLNHHCLVCILAAPGNELSRPPRLRSLPATLVSLVVSCPL